MKRMIGFCCLLLLASRWSSAQSNEVSFSAGAIFTSDQNVTTTTLLPCPIGVPNCNVISSTLKANTAFTFEASYARRLTGAGPIALYLELPVLGTPGHDVSAVISSPFTQAGGSTSSSLFFLTPSARVRFFSSAKISPWVTVGAGWARLTQGSENANKGAVQFGGGVDFKTGLPHLRLRGEVRDFWSGGALQSSATISVVSPNHQHHVFAGGGVVFRF